MMVAAMRSVYESKYSVKLMNIKIKLQFILSFLSLTLHIKKTPALECGFHDLLRVNERGVWFIETSDEKATD